MLFRSLTGLDSRLLATVMRLAPGLFRRMTDAEVRKAVAHADRKAS